MTMAWKELIFYAKKYALIELLLIIMIFMVIFLSGLANGLGRWVSAGIENIDADYFVLAQDAEGILTFSSLDDNVKEDLEKLNLDDAASLSAQRSGITLQDKDQKEDITYFVVDPDSFIQPDLASGDALASDPEGIVVNESFIDKGLKLGDSLTDASSDLPLKVVGFAKDAYYGHSPVGYISQETYTKIRQAKQKDYKYEAQAYVSQEDLGSDKDLEDLTILDKASVIENIPGYKAEQSTLNMILWVLLAASAAILGVFFFIITIQKTRQFGVLKAIGMSMNEIMASQLWQVFLLALIGVLIGGGLAIGLAQVLPASMPFFLNYTQVALVCLAFVLISLLTSLASILRIRKIDPAMIIGGGEE